MDTSWTQQRCPCFFFRKSGSKGVRIQTAVSQSRKMNYCWAELDWNWKTGYSINKEGKPNSEEGCWASDRHTCFQKTRAGGYDPHASVLVMDTAPWGPFVSSMHRPSPPWWTVSAVPHARPSSSTRASFLARFQAVCAIRAVSSLS